MTTRRRRNAAYLTLFVLCTVIGFNLANAQGAERFTAARRHRFCRYESSDGHAGFTHAEVHLLLSCAADHFPVLGGFAQAHAITERESGDTCRARNPYSSATGLFQIVAGTWASWYSTTAPRLRGWGIHDDPSLCRANAIIGMVAAHRWGWSPWGG